METPNSGNFRDLGLPLFGFLTPGSAVTSAIEDRFGVLATQHFRKAGSDDHDIGSRPRQADRPAKRAAGVAR